MPIINRIAELHTEIRDWRRALHAKPEILFDVHETAAFVTQKLESFGCDDVMQGIGRTGVVALIHGARGSGPCIGLRADMDALPLIEQTSLPYASEVSGAMHACGHDGHTAMLLGAAKYLAETRNFAGTVAFIFQPAEEGGGGGRELVQDGMMERFGISRVFGMHNLPGMPVGQFGICPGPVMASTGELLITVEGQGGHAAIPNKAIDPVVIAAQIILAIQTITSRNLDPLDALVISITTVHGGDAHNIIPAKIVLEGTVRTLKTEVTRLAVDRMTSLAQGIALAHGARAEVVYSPNYPVTVNHPEEVDFSLAVAREVAGHDNVDANAAPLMAGEDFSYMLEARPGTFIFIGNGDSAGLHNPRYDFDDDAIPYGVSYWVRLVETALKA